jgi:hypothetical protein
VGTRSLLFPLFQHGDTSQDSLLAHTLAMVAVAKGASSALWIAAATLDRYLQKIGQPQIFGTQFQQDGKNDWSQDPFDRDLISDPLRQRLGVPILAAQKMQFESITRQYPIPEPTNQKNP